MALTGCAKDKTVPPPDIDVEVADSYQLVLKDWEVDGYDFTALFSVTVDGAKVAVDSAWVDVSAVKAESGTYEVVCSYGGDTATVYVTVETTVRKLAFTPAANGGAITLLRSQVDGYDFNALFKATEDGKTVTITDDMVETDVEAKAGEYTYTVSYGTSLTLAVIVRDDILVVPAYRTAEVAEDALDGFDFTSLFSLYVEDKAVKVTPEMIDASAAENAEKGDTFDVAFSYTYKNTPYTAKVAVKIVDAAQYTVGVKDAETYPHAENIDLTTLFEVKKDGKPVPVTSDMITGEIDYMIDNGETEKVSVITLHFNGKTYDAHVTVKSGVVIGYKNGDRITVTKGTNKAKYPFAGDFSVTVDGVGFLAIPEAYLVGYDALDFDTVGEYSVTLRIPYCNTRPTLSGGVTFAYTEKTIKYVVSEYDSSVRVYKEHVTLKNGTTSYNPFDNINVLVNGKLMNLTSNKDWISAITCYAEVKSDAIDFTDAATQKVVVDVYASGLNAAPVTVEFDVTIESGIVVTAKDLGVFAGATLYTKDLFTVEKNGEPIEVTYDMITGKADTFTPGTYEITVNYEGMTATANVTVFESGMQGTYRTKLTTIPVSSDDDDDDADGDYGWGGSGDDWYGDGEYSLTPTSASGATARAATGGTTLGDMVIAEDGSIVVDGKKATIVGGVDESTMLLQIGTNNYTMYYDNGIIVLDPDNSLKLGFSDYRRPLVYFNTDMWTVETKVEINYSDSHVLGNSFVGYTIDTFKLKSTKSDDVMWYGLKIQLVEKQSADTIYRVSWGEAVFADGFKQKEGEVSSVTFLGDVYGFTMNSAGVAKVNRSTTNTALKGTYRGSYNGADARLVVGDNGGFEFTVGGNKLASYILNDYGNYKNSYVDDATKTIFAYKFKDDGSNLAFSYKFKLDTEKGTFAVEERDGYYGRYETDGMFVYLDGYGTGAVNFDTSTFASTQIKYTVKSGVVCISFVNISQSFKYGERAEFYLGEFLNTLAVKSADSDVFAGKRFVNAIITDGAVINIDSGVIGKTTTNLGTAELLQAIHIITKDGELDTAAKTAAVDLAYVSFGTPGFYNYSIALSVGGKDVTANYAVQIADTVDGDPTVYTAFGSGVMNGSVALNLTAHGTATIIATGVRYEGTASAISGGKFVVKAYAQNGSVIVAECTKVADGVLQVTTTGAISLTDYFTTGSNRVCGIDGFAIREFTVGTQKTYIVSNAASLAGEVAEVVFESGSGDADSVMTVTTSNGTKRIRIVTWGKTSDGLIVLD